MTDKRRPKREMSPFGHVVRTYVDIPLDARDAAYSVDLKSRKMDTRNGVTRQRLSAVAGNATCEAGGQAVCPGGRDVDEQSSLKKLMLRAIPEIC